MDGPGETDNEAEDLPPAPVKVEARPEAAPEVRQPEPVKTEQPTGEEDSAQIAKKIKGLLSLKAKKPEEGQVNPDSEPEPPAQPTTPPPVERKDERKEEKADVPVASPSSVPGEFFPSLLKHHFFHGVSVTLIFFTCI